ncbi:hypothetical protein [Nonomuraea roseoviolacea]|uniref:Flavin-binding protein dodecin n=1 Tax=Nonomuraea roseoviolacea subsp. carminata TaxID=160689 RepID=A0ABT1KFA1_9ACTN|nr:hypothetical protein [Nonomuraea roseoviolacea]MCP2351619.1 flavin-binding protein dodecin [Nonomuraea roseoviolacea subsp. carminata]
MTSLIEPTNHSRARRYAARTGAASLAACLTLVLGGGVADAATADSAANAARRLDRVDWAAVVKPALHCPQAGSHASWNVVRARVAAVGDLTRDGRRETVVVSSCPSPTSSNPSIAFVYDGAAKPSAPRLLGKLGTNRYFTSLKVGIQGGTVHLRGKALSDKAPRCCPDLIVEQTYTWDGKQFRRTAEKAKRIG